MNCSQCRALLDSYLDQELSAAVACAAEEHIRACFRCRRALDERRELSAAVKHSTRDPSSMPFDLQQGVLARLRPPPDRRRSLTRLSRPWVGIATAAVLASAASSALTYLLAVPSEQERLIDDAISAHTRSLQVGHLTDVAASDPAVIRHWFRGQGQIAPVVKDLASAGFPLLGGRLDYLYKRAVIALVYEYKGRTINLYMWSTEEDAPRPIDQFTDEGLNLVFWQTSEMAFCAISELGAADLLSFTRVFASA